MIMKNKDLIKVPIESYFAGDYRLEYDGKYITLFGKDKTYPVNAYGFDVEGRDSNGEIHYEEMVLVSCVAEVRNARPEIAEVDNDYIHIKLNVHEKSV
jgi:hypothetical protein